MLEGLKAWIYRLTHEYQGCGNPDCSVSHGIHEGLTFGSGHLDKFGFWENPCYVCAREWEKRYPKYRPCWPFTPEVIQKLKGTQS